MTQENTTRRAGPVAADQHAAANSVRQGAAVSTTATGNGLNVDAAPETTPCTWTKPYEGPWETSCGNLFEIIEATPRENGMTFCCYCGAHLVEKIEHADA
jgi:hypothetical protein